MDKQEILEGVEVAVEAGIEKYVAPCVEEIIEKLKELIPGGLDDVVLEAAQPEIEKIVKKFLLAQAEKIDGKEG